jgi:tetratricopeptide (TPR) repeat protein
MMRSLNIPTETVWLIGLLAGLCVVYLPGLDNELIFDDVRLLKDRILWENYGSLWPLKQRLLSYGSFVWIENIFGEGWWKQRLFNLALHVMTTIALYALFRQLLARVAWQPELAEQPGFESSVRASLQVGVLLFALNPVAVYAVGYLIQRSILAATLFVVLGLAAFVRALTHRSPLWYGLALVCYAAALLSKEHAVMAPVVAIAIYVFIRPPTKGQLAAIVAACLAGLGVASVFLLRIYGDLIGTAFDELSRTYIDELIAIDPAIMDRAWPLSIINQATLFFFYGFLWLVPVVSWMSIDLRPPFPVSFFSWPHWLGALGYVAVLAGAVWLLLRRTGAARYAGLCLLMPTLLFATEFSTVWIQDPFVLYRSYLWAIALPGLFVLVLAGLRPVWIHAVGLIIIVLFALLAFERMASMHSKLSVWQDASEKTALFDSPSAVGRWRPFLNKGSYYMENTMPEMAARDFERAIALGERRGHAHYNLGVALQVLGRLDKAIEAFDTAEARGTTHIAALYVNRGEARFALGDLQKAIDDFEKALTMPLEAPVRRLTQDKLAKASLAIGAYEKAQNSYAELLTATPDDYEARLGHALALTGLADSERALQELDALLARQAHPSAHYGRAIALHQLGRSEEAFAAVDRALTLQPDNPSFLAFRERVRSAASSATTGRPNE